MAPWNQSFTTLTHTPLTPTHVISNISSPISSDTLSLPSAPHSPNLTTRNRSSSQSTATAHELNPTRSADVHFTVPSSLLQRLRKSPDTESEAGTDVVPPSSLISPRLITIPPVQTPLSGPSSTLGSGPGSASTSTCQTPAAERDEDSPFGPLLPDTPRSSPALYGARPFSPIVSVMGSASSSSSRSEIVNGPPLSRLPTPRGLGNISRRGSALAHELTREDGDGDDTGALTNGTLDTDGRSPIRVEEDARCSDVDMDLSYANSSIASLSQRYPAPPTPPVLVSPPPSDGVRSLPSSSSPASPTLSFLSPPQPPQPNVSVSTLRVPPVSRSRSRERSTHHSPALSSPTASFASFASPISTAYTVSMSEASESDEFLSAADTDTDGESENCSLGGAGTGVRTSPTSSTGTASSSSAPVFVPDTDRAYDPFMDFEEVGSNGSSEGSWEIHDSAGYH